MVYRRTARSEKVRAAARAKILRAARKLFAERGYDQTTMQEIVREAKTSIGNAYFYFSNKEDLLRTLLVEAVLRTWARTDEVTASVEPGPVRVAVAVYANIMNFVTAEKALTRIAVSGEPRVVRHILELQTKRLRALFADNFPGRSEKETLMSVIAIGGANRLAIEVFLAGQLGEDARELADFLVSWHLRALSLPEAEITRVLRIAARTVKRGAAVTKPLAEAKASRAKTLRG